MLKGLGRDRSAWIHISGPTIEHKLFGVSTQKVVDGKPVDHMDVEIVAGPSKPIQGVVRAADTGQPLGGVWIYGGNFGGEIPNDNMRGIRAMTDAQGHFRLDGMAKANSYKLRAFPRDDQPYIMKELTIGDTQGLAPAETEIKLSRGVLVRFRLVDKVTGQPKLGLARYTPYDDNGVFSDDTLRNQFFHRSASADEHGVYSLVVPTGTGLITAFIGDGSYVPARVRDSDRAKYPLIDSRRSYASMMVHAVCHGYRMVDLKIDDRPEVYDIELDPGRKIVGSLVGPDGKPATGVAAYGLLGASTRDGAGIGIDLVAGTFSVEGLDPDRECATDDPLRSEGCRPDRPGRPSRRRAEAGPGATRSLGICDRTLGRQRGQAAPRCDIATACFVVPLAQLLTDAKGHSAPEQRRESVADPVQTNSEGRFRIDGLARGMAYELVLVTPVKKEVFMVGEAKTVETPVSSTDGNPIKGQSLTPGEIRDLGDVRVDGPQ